MQQDLKNYYRVVKYYYIKSIYFNTFFLYMIIIMKANFCRVSQSWSAISNEHLVTVVTARVSLGIPVSHGVVLGHYRGYTVYIYIFFYLI